MFKEENLANVDLVCQDIMYLLYMILSKVSQLLSDTSVFERDELNVIQVENGSSFNDVYKTNMSTLYSDDDDNRCR